MTDISIRIHMLVTSAVSSVFSKLQREDGQDLIEYAVLAGAIGIVAAIALFATPGISTSVGKFAGSIKNCVDISATTYVCP